MANTTKRKTMPAKMTAPTKPFKKEWFVTVFLKPLKGCENIEYVIKLLVKCVMSWISSKPDCRWGIVSDFLDIGNLNNLSA